MSFYRITALLIVICALVILPQEAFGDVTAEPIGFAVFAEAEDTLITEITLTNDDEDAVSYRCRYLNVDREEDERKIKNILLKIKDKFVGGYNNILAEWTGDVKVFKPFFDELDEIVWQYVLEKYGNAFQELITNKKRRIDEVVTAIHRLFAPKIATKLIDHILEDILQ